MEFELNEAIRMLERTPPLLSVYLRGLPEAWTHQNEGDNTWSPFDVVGHLIHGEKTDWMVRAQIILSDHSERPFEPFDRFAQSASSKGKSMAQLLDEFGSLRAQNLDRLKALRLSEKDLAREGMHPELGKVTLRQLLATWVAHDLGHIVQISRVMAKQYTAEVGPWVKYLGVLQQ